jgi:Uma2 family endonuclease
MAKPQPVSFISEDDYLQGEEVTAIRHEYVDGQVYGMAGTSAKYNLVAGNAFSLLHAQLPDHCEVFMADMKVRIQLQRKVLFYYPDVMVSCAADDRAEYYRVKPCLIIEVLSLSTERQDRFEKFWSYQQIPSLQEYLLLNQNFQEATLFRRANGWEPEVYREGTLHLASVGLDIPLDTLYRRVRFD